MHKDTGKITHSTTNSVPEAKQTNMEPCCPPGKKEEGQKAFIRVNIVH